MKITKQEIIKGLTKIGGNLSAFAEVQADVNFILEDYKANSRNVTMEDLKDSMSKIEKATKKTFSQLVAEAEGQQEIVPNNVKPLPIKKEEKVENSKKILTPKAPKEEKVEEIKEDSKKVEEHKEEKPKADNKKATTVYTDKDGVVSKFAQTFKSKSLKADLVARPDLKSIEDIAKAYSEDTDFVIATYWTKRQLKQYADSYDPMGINPNKPTAFENDLDLIEVTYANDLVVTGCSLYSFVPQIFMPKDFAIDPDTNLRFANGVEFEVYEIVAE